MTVIWLRSSLSLFPLPQPVWCWNKNIPRYLGQCRGWRRPGPLLRQATCSYNIICAAFMRLCIWQERISTTWFISALSNDRKCRYISLFLKYVQRDKVIRFLIYFADCVSTADHTEDCPRECDKHTDCVRADGVQGQCVHHDCGNCRCEYPAGRKKVQRAQTLR